jgi:fumarate reductase flavoprotein subunit
MRKGNTVKGNLGRREFLKGALATGALAATAGVVGCSSGTNTSSNGSTTVTTTYIPGDESTLPSAPQIDSSKITSTLSCDVVVCGAGVSGIAAARSAVEAGAKVVVLEKNSTIEVHGFGCGIVNSTFAKDLGVTVDPLDLIREYERRSYDRINMQLVQVWAQHSGEAFDWWIKPAEADSDVTNAMTLNYYPLYPEHDPAGDLTKTYLGCIDFKEDAASPLGSPQWIKVGTYNQQLAASEGVDFHFSTVAVKLIANDAGEVTGVYGKDADGNYVQVNASKGVILTTGGFTQFGCGPEDMTKVFTPNLYKNYLETKGTEPAWQEHFTVNAGPITGASGDGQLMAVWAGGAMDPWADSCMGSCESGIGGTVAMTVNQDGVRFHNEDIGIWEKHSQVFRQPGKICYDIIDVNWRDRLPYQAIGHRNFDYHEHQVAAGWDGFSYVDNFHKEFLSAVGNPNGIVPTLDPHAGTVYAANTIDELAQIIDVPADTFKASVTRYNQMCAQKRDDDFGCDSQKLFAIETGPFFACSATAAPAFGAYAGLCTDGKFQVLNKEGQPIKGLWSAGNCCGGKFAPSYITPMPAMNHGNCVVHGYHAGLNAAQA